MQVAVLSRIPLLSIFLVFLITQCSAQDHPRFNISAGAGVSIPTSDASANLKTGWNFVVRGGVNVSRDLLADLDFSYNHFSLTNAALANSDSQLAMVTCGRSPSHLRFVSLLAS